VEWEFPPIFVELAKQAAAADSDVEFYKFDVDHPDLKDQEIEKLDVRSLPTFRLFKDGEKVAEVVGALPAKLSGFVKEVLEARKEELLAPTTEASENKL